MILKLATRPSKLAVAQSNLVAKALEERHVGLNVELVIITSQGDKDQQTPISEFGGTGAFVKELELALINGDADFAVHSLKDVPSVQPNGLVLCAFPKREDPRDIFISKNWISWKDMPLGSTIGTSSMCRLAQLKALRPDFIFKEIRGNIDTRIAKCYNGDYDAIILAAAGLNRLNIPFPQSAIFRPEEMIPSPGQGALAIQVHEDNKLVMELLKTLNDPKTALAVKHERNFMTLLDGGCREPLAALVSLAGNNAQVLLMSGKSSDFPFKTSKISCNQSELEALITNDVKNKYL